ncbi:MAG: SCP2 sterol-binding domain-containing protein [Candidatus Bathyarchaeia archaeon]
MVKFLSLDYWKQVEETANSDEEFGLKARGFTASFTFKVTDREELPPIYVKFDDGEVTELRELREGERTDFTLEGPYETWVGVNKGEMDAANAIMTRQLQFRGSMSAIIRYSKAFLRLFQLMQQVPVEY